MLLLRSPWHGALQALPLPICICSASGSLGPSLPTGLSGLFQEQHLPITQPSVFPPSLKPESGLPLATLQYFLPKYQILSCLQRKHMQKLYPFGCLTTSVKYVCDKTAFFYGKWAPQWASQTHSPLCELSLPSGGSVMLLHWTFIWL